MKRSWLWIALGVLLLAGAYLILPQVRFDLHPFVATCLRDNEIDTADRQAVQDTASRFVRDLVGQSPQTAYASMTQARRSAISAREFEALATQVHSDASPAPLTIAGAYLVKATPGAGQDAFVPCGLSNPRGVDFVRLGSAPKQAHVILVEPVTNGQQTFAVSLLFESGKWKADGFHTWISEIAGRGGAELWAQAKQQRQRGHLFNATMLYAVASQALDGGPYYHPAAWSEFRKDYQTFTPTPELKGPPPYNWSLGQKTFKISSVSYIGLDDHQVMLIIYQPLVNWLGERDADHRNHELIDAFVAAHPEWIESFDGIVVRSTKPDDNSGYGTVYTKRGGFAPSKPAN